MTGHNGPVTLTSDVDSTGTVLLSPTSGTLTLTGTGTLFPLPTQTGQTGRYLTTDGTTLSWAAVATGGTTTVTTTTTTLDPAWQAYIVRCTHADGCTLTVPSTLPNGYTLTLTGTGTITLVPGSGTTMDGDGLAWLAQPGETLYLARVAGTVYVHGGTPYQTAAQLWLRTDTRTDADTTTLSSWLDHTARSETVHSGSPQVRTNMLNSRRVCQYDSTDYHTLPPTSVRSLYVVARWTSNPSAIGGLLSAVGDQSIRLQTTAGGTLEVSGLSGTHEIRVNGAATALWPTSTWAVIEVHHSQPQTSYARLMANTAVARYLGGEVAELVMLSGPVTGTLRSAIRQRLAHRWGITVTP
jgi:hypothetical protein